MQCIACSNLTLNREDIIIQGNEKIYKKKPLCSQHRCPVCECRFEDIPFYCSRCESELMCSIDCLQWTRGNVCVKCTMQDYDWMLPQLITFILQSIAIPRDISHLIFDYINDSSHQLDEQLRERIKRKRIENANRSVKGKKL